MRALMLKFVNRLYELFKFYSIMALLGALAGVVIGIVVEKPVVLIALFAVVVATCMIIMLSAQAQETAGQKLSQDERPPILPESLMIVSLPSQFADEIIGDLRDEYDHLRSKYGRYSAVTWYTIQSGTTFIKALAFHCGFSFGKSLKSERAQIYADKR